MFLNVLGNHQLVMMCVVFQPFFTTGIWEISGHSTACGTSKLQHFRTHRAKRGGTSTWWHFSMARDVNLCIFIFQICVSWHHYRGRFCFCFGWLTSLWWGTGDIWFRRVFVDVYPYLVICPEEDVATSTSNTTKLTMGIKMIWPIDYPHYPGLSGPIWVEIQR